VFELKTKSGRTIKASGNHKFLTKEYWQPLEKLETEQEVATINQQKNPEIYWDKIQSITPLKAEEVYDATVEGAHNFIANDICVHNSLEQDSDVVMLLYREDRDKLDTTVEEQNTVEVMIAKHRNGPLGNIKLKFDPEKVSFRDIDTHHTNDT